MSPRVSLGLPVYNGESYVAHAIESILGQSFEDFELVICDNASTDDTPRICKAFCAQDRRLRYFRNETNIGAGPNFNRTMERSLGTYFKWCACDDVLSPNFLDACVRVLDADRDVVLAYGDTRSIDDALNPIPLVGSLMSEKRDEKPADRFGKFISEVSNCYEVFGLFRSDTLRRTSLHRPYYGSDRALLAELALLGKFAFVPGAILYNREHSDRSVNIRDEKARAAWQAASNAGWGLVSEYRALVIDLFRVAVRHRQVAPLGTTLPPLIRWTINGRVERWRRSRS